MRVRVKRERGKAHCQFFFQLTEFDERMRGKERKERKLTSHDKKQMSRECVKFGQWTHLPLQLDERTNKKSKIIPAREREREKKNRISSASAFFFDLALVSAHSTMRIVITCLSSRRLTRLFVHRRSRRCRYARLFSPATERERARQNTASTV